MTRMVWALMIAMAACFLPGNATADVLLIEEVRQAERMELPDNGMSQAEVRARFGEPEQVHSAVGEPPITRWDYDRWSVYFEHELVLFTVLHKGAVLDKNEEGDG